jgi:hypothetical protein
MLAKALMMIGSIKAPQNVGDVLDTCEQPAVAVDETAGGVTLTAAQFVQALKVAVSGNAGAVATTLPTAEQIIAAIQGQLNKIVPPANIPYDSAHDGAPEMQWPANLGVIPPDTTFRFFLSNANAGTNTLTPQASSGVLAIVGTATVATNVWREWIVRIISSAPAVTIGCTTTNASLVLSNVDKNLIKQLQPGMSVFGTGIGALARVTAVNYEAGTVSVSVASTATANNIGVSFTPTLQFTNFRAGAI